MFLEEVHMEVLSYAFNSKCTFPFERCLFKFEGREFALISGNEEYCEVIQTIIDNPKERSEVFEAIHKFLFRFGWANNCSFNYRGHIAEGLAKPIDIFKRRRVLYIKRHYRNLLVDLAHLISPTTFEQEVALSLYNDAQYSANPFYAFVCYWKILELPFATRTLKAEDWVNDIIRGKHRIHITDHLSVEDCDSPGGLSVSFGREGSEMGPVLG